MPLSPESRLAGRASGRSFRALLFAIFGAFWLLLSTFYFKALGPLTLGDILFGALVLIILVILGLRLRHQASSLRQNRLPDPEGKTEDRRFGIVNAITYTTVLLFVILPRLGLSNYVFPCFVGLVGLHLFPMPPLYQSRSDQITGAFLVLWAVFCVLLFRADGKRLAALVTLGAGLALWASSLAALHTAHRLLHRATH